MAVDIRDLEMEVWGRLDEDVDASAAAGLAVM